MRKATLIWFGGHDKPYRSITLSKRTIVTVATSAGALALATLALMTTTIFMGSALSEERDKTAELSKALEMRTVQVEDLTARTNQLVEDNRIKKAELEEVELLEARLKTFLGFPSDSTGAVKSNQGGVPSSLHIDSEARNLKAFEFSSNSETSFKGLSDILAYLEEERERLRDVPTILPVKGTKKDIWVSCSFGWRENPFTGDGKEFHNGLDIAGPHRTPIIAPADGMVIASGKDYYLGDYIKISHASGITTSYGHLNERLVKKGDKVKRGDVIARMGNSGRSTGTHLHYAVIKDNQYVSPSKYIWDGFNNPLASREK